MRTTIDRAGRLVVPKAIRDRLCLGGGDEVEIVERSGVVEISPVRTAVDLVATSEGPVLVPREPQPVLSDDDIRTALEDVRR